MIQNSRLIWVLGAGFSLIALGCARSDDRYAPSRSLTSTTTTQAQTGNDPYDDGSDDGTVSTDPGNMGGDDTTGGDTTATTVKVAGQVTYDSVPATPSGLNYSATAKKPVRGALIEIVQSTDSAVLASGTTTSDGRYELSVPSNTMMFVRVRARLYKTGTPSYDFKVVDNTRSKAMYVMDSAPFSSGAIDTPDKNLHAVSGWSGAGYSSARMAAPFAILDVLYQNLGTLLAADPSVALPALQVNWSVSNTPASGSTSLGQITTTHFNNSEGQLYVLGAQNVDTDEYDSHIIAHEWAHYLEHRLSRTDSLGGNHTLSANMDPRVAFSEGFANAFSGISLGSPSYNDTSGNQQAVTQISFGLESRPYGSSVGPYSETSVQTVLYNFYQDQGVSGGASFAPILGALRGLHKSTSAFTTIYSFINAIRFSYPTMLTRLNSLLSGESITVAAQDAFDSTMTESNFAGLSGVRYLYRRLDLGGTAGAVCSKGDLGNFNRAFNRRYFYFTVNTTRTFTVKAVPSSTGDAVVILYKQGVKLKVQDAAGTAGTERLQMSLGPGTYVGEVYDRKIVNNTATNTECITLSLE